MVAAVTASPFLYNVFPCCVTGIPCCVSAVPLAVMTLCSRDIAYYTGRSYLDCWRVIKSSLLITMANDDLF